MPSNSGQRAAGTPRVCQWVNQADALEQFVRYEGTTQSQQHIKPLHWYVACRLVLEGGFHPDEIKPRPPFTVTRRRGRHLLDFDPGTATGREATVLGGLKTKNVDVVISKDGLGPVLAVSCKGMTGAFRNLTNRMEETIGECTNLHLTYPALVFGYLFVIRANEAPDAAALENSRSGRGSGEASRLQRYRPYGLPRARGVDCPVPLRARRAHRTQRYPGGRQSVRGHFPRAD